MAKPVPRENEVLIEIYGTSVPRGDTRMRGLDIPGPGCQRLAARLVLGITRPRRAVLGMQLAGRVEAAGRKVTKFLLKKNKKAGKNIRIYFNVDPASDKI